MDETFWGLYEAQISALKSCFSADEANLIMLETAKFLVEHIDLSVETVDMYDKFGFRKLFAAHNALGNAVTSFYDSERERLDPAALQGAIGQKIEVLSERITATSDNLEKLQALEKELLSKEEELNGLETELETWREKVEHLRMLDMNAVAEIQKYKEQFEKLECAITAHDAEVSVWKAHLGEDSVIISKMETYGVGSLSSLLGRIEALKTHIVNDLSSLDGKYEVLAFIKQNNGKFNLGRYSNNDKEVENCYLSDEQGRSLESCIELIEKLGQ